jgi:hypothetical protein
VFADQSCEFQAFDQLDPAVVEWKTLVNPLEGNLTTRIPLLPELPRLEMLSDIIMLSSDGELGKWNFGFEVQVGWDKQLPLTAGNGDMFGGVSSPSQRLPTPQSDEAEGSVVYHFTDEAGGFTCHTGWICPWCEGHPASFGSVDELERHLELHLDLFSFRIEVLLFWGQLILTISVGRVPLPTSLWNWHAFTVQRMAVSVARWPRGCSPSRDEIKTGYVK